MDKQAVVERIAEIGKAIESSLSQHNALVGRLNEAQYMLQLMEKIDQDLINRNITGVVGDVIDGAEEIVSEKKTSGTPGTGSSIDT